MSQDNLEYRAASLKYLQTTKHVMCCSLRSNILLENPSYYASIWSTNKLLSIVCLWCSAVQRTLTELCSGKATYSEKGNFVNFAMKLFY